MNVKRKFLKQIKQLQVRNIFVRFRQFSSLLATFHHFKSPKLGLLTKYFLGMLPYRDDFTPECIDEAELILVNKPEDLPPSVQQLVGDMFHRQFHERHRKRKLIREWKLVDRSFDKIVK